mmetsp:Transcript_42075/g.112178  ORF Transcript_42075/g.112178 Transcript_42075/m.112178 type:complete len:295 (-) Transcript_42075:354-1238(-)
MPPSPVQLNVAAISRTSAMESDITSWLDGICPPELSLAELRTARIVGIPFSSSSREALPFLMKKERSKTGVECGERCEEEQISEARRGVALRGPHCLHSCACHDQSPWPTTTHHHPPFSTVCVNESGCMRKGNMSMGFCSWSCASSNSVTPGLAQPLVKNTLVKLVIRFSVDSTTSSSLSTMSSGRTTSESSFSRTARSLRALFTSCRSIEPQRNSAIGTACTNRPAYLPSSAQSILCSSSSNQPNFLFFLSVKPLTIPSTVTFCCFIASAWTCLEVAATSAAVFCASSTASRV